MSSNAKDPPLVWVHGLQVAPADSLPPEIRALTDWEGGGFAVFRPQGRSAPMLVDAETADLLEGFRSPSTIIQAIIRHGERHEGDPHEILRQRLPLVRKLLAKRFLVVADGDGSQPPPATGMTPGDRLGDLDIARLLQRMEDTEVYQVRTADGHPAALKIQRGKCSETRRLLEGEARVLRHLAGDPAPRLLRAGEHDGQPYLLLEWCAGSDAGTAAEEWRLRRTESSLRRLVRICRQIARAFGRIHEHGIVHGDVHPGNVLVDRQDRVRLIDFGLARFTAGAGPAESRIERGGVTLFLEPELARCLLADEPLPAATPAGEQYAVAALMYQLLTGFPYLDFSLERQALLRQIVSAPPVSFQDRGLAPWPQVEALLARALAKKPARRFPSLGALAKRLATVAPPPAQRCSAARDDDLKQLPDPVLDQTSLDGLWLSNGQEPPLSPSLFFGAAGIAYAIYRVAFLRQQPELLARADTWLDRAESNCDPAAAPPDPFPGADRKPGHGADRMDPTSPFHATSGVHAVRAMVASAGSRPAEHAKAVEAWLAATRHPSFNSKPPRPDLATGRAGSLLAAALLTEDWLPSSPIELAQVTELGNRIRDELWSSLAKEPVVRETLGQIGIAHGWAGLLYASLRWCETTASDPPTETEQRLHELAGLAQPAGRGLIWPWELPWREANQPDFMAGWCAGSAGYALLFALATDCFPRAHFADVALGAGWNAWESSQREGSLCCGLAGRACAMLRLHQMTGDAVWLDRAHDLAQLAAGEGRFDQTLPHSLYKGRLGLELLAVELEHPLRGRFPFF